MNYQNATRTATFATRPTRSLDLIVRSYVSGMQRSLAFCASKSSSALLKVSVIGAILFPAVARLACEWTTDVRRVLDLRNIH